MAKSIAPLTAVSNSLDSVSKFIRVLEKEGVTLEQLLLPINDLEARANLVAFLSARCSAFKTLCWINKHGHLTFRIEGLNLTGEQELLRHQALGYEMSRYAEAIFQSEGMNSYSIEHRLQQGQPYNVVIVCCDTNTRLINERTPQKVRQWASETYGYQMPRAGIVPRLRELLTEDRIKKMNTLSITALHESIPVRHSPPGILGLDIASGYRIVGSAGNPNVDLYEHFNFAFVEPLAQ